MSPVKMRWPLALLLIVFILCKWPHLSYPYYWDESWSYLPALNAMFHHGASLMPNAIAPVLSRGHPLLFHSLATMCTDVFGCSRLALHGFALFLSASLLIAVYEGTLRMFGERTAIISTLLIATQETFFVQSSFLLPEVLVALLSFISLWAHVHNKYLLVALSLTALFYTKETGMVLGALLLADAAIGFIRQDIPFQKRIFSIVAVILPFLFVAFFFALQKLANGWYLFPEHTNLVMLEWGEPWFRFRMCCVKPLFYEDRKYLYYILLLLFAVIAAIRSKTYRLLFILLPGAIIAFFVLVDPQVHWRVGYAGMFVVAVGLFLYKFCNWRIFPQASQRRFFVLGTIFIFLFFAVSSMNFFTARYLICATVILLILTGALLDVFITRSARKWLYYMVLAAIPVICFISFNASHSTGDTQLDAYDAMQVEQATIDYIEQHVPSYALISAGAPLICYHLCDTATGFLRKGHKYTNVDGALHHETQYAIIDNIENNSKLPGQIQQDTTMIMVYRVQCGIAWGEVYERKHH